VVEGDSAIFTISGSVPVSQPVTVNYSMRGSAWKGHDYTLSGTPGQVTIATGQSSATVVLQSVADRITERNETAVMALVSTSGGYKLPKSGAKSTLMILNGP
jgi:hypothetical protein